MEEKEANEMEMAAKAHEEREKVKEAAQGWIKISSWLKIIKAD